MSFFDELKRRNVFRVGIAYVVVGWLLLQVTDIVVPIMELPNSVAKVVLFLLMIGFPLVIFFAWAFELTPEGIKKEKDVDRSQSQTPVTGRKLDRAIIGILVVALGWFVWDKFGMGSEPFSQTIAEQQTSETDEKRALTQSKSVAVLPFVNMSSDPEQEFFSDGISEEILNALAKVKDLKVAGRTSSFAFKGKNQDLRQIGEMLGVNHILEGSVRKSGNQVRITAQLIQVETGFHLWSETYDRELTNIFAIQDEIAAAILEQMKAELLDGESEAMLAKQTDSQAYELYLLAKQRIYERNRGSLEAAATMLDSALEIDPQYTPALAQRAIATLLLSVRNYGTLPVEESDLLAKSFADRAIALDPDSAETLSALGLYHSNRPTEVQEAVEYLEKALSINPNLINASNWLQQSYSGTGELQKSLGITEAMVERDPLYPPGVSNLVIAYLNRARLEEASELIEKMEVFMPGDSGLIAMRGAVAGAFGRFAESESLMEQAIQQVPEHGTYKFGLGFNLLATQQYEKLLRDSMPPFMRIRSLHAVGNTEEATISAYERAAIGDIDPLFQLMNREGRYQDLVSFFDDRWPDLASFKAEYPGGQRGYGPMLDLALAFSKTGNQERFDQAMALVRSHHDRLIEQGMKVDIMYFREACYYALLNDHSEAMDQLETAINLFGTSSARIAWEYPALLPLEGDARYEALQQRMVDHINDERAKLDLEPVSI